MAKSRICLFFSDTGGGHRSAVDAIMAAIHDLLEENGRLNDFEMLAENIVEKSHPVNRIFVDLYNYLLRNNQAAMKYYFWFIQQFKPNDSKLGYLLVKKYLLELIRDYKPSVMVSVHPMINHYLSKSIEDSGVADTLKLVTVVTDPNGNFWKGWACPAADLTLVPNELSKQQLVDWHIDPDKIRCVGMPVHPDFIKPAHSSRDEFLTHLGLYKDRLTICINAGWAGGGNMRLIYDQLVGVTKPIQVVFLCGHNKELYESMKREARKSAFPTAVLPFHDRLSDVMSAVDLMVSKAGGLTTFETIARKLPMAVDLITEPMPQEKGTVEILIEKNLAYGIKTPEDIVSIVENFEPRPDRWTFELPSDYHLNRTAAVYDIAHTIIRYCDPSFPPLARRDGIAVEQEGRVDAAS